MPEALPAVWDAEAFRAKRREAQLALEIIPKYAEAMRQAGPRPEFEHIMKESIEMHMDDEYEEAMFDMLKQRALARAFLCWREAARHHKKIIEAKLKAGNAPAFSSKLEMLASQQPRVQLRRGQGSSAVLAVAQNGRTSIGSSVTTDATRPSVADDFDVKAEYIVPPSPIAESESDSADLVNLYREATKAEQVHNRASKRIPKRVESTKRLGAFVSVLGRVASFRGRPKE
jgi:hypothetical protein